MSEYGDTDSQWASMTEEEIRQWAADFGTNNSWYWSDRQRRHVLIEDGDTTTRDLGTLIAAGGGNPVAEADYWLIVARMTEVDAARRLGQAREADAVSPTFDNLLALTDAERAYAEATATREDLAATADAARAVAAGRGHWIELDTAWRQALTITIHEQALADGNDGSPEYDWTLPAAEYARREAALAFLERETGVPAGRVCQQLRQDAYAGYPAPPDWTDVTAQWQQRQAEIDAQQSPTPEAPPASTAPTVVDDAAAARDDEPHATPERDSRETVPLSETQRGTDLDTAWREAVTLSHRERVIRGANDGPFGADLSLPREDQARRDASIATITERTRVPRWYIHNRLDDALYAHGLAPETDDDPDYFAPPDWAEFTQRYTAAEAADEAEAAWRNARYAETRAVYNALFDHDYYGRIEGDGRAEDSYSDQIWEAAEGIAESRLAERGVFPPDMDDDLPSAEEQQEIADAHRAPRFWELPGEPHATPAREALDEDGSLNSAVGYPSEYPNPAAPVESPPEPPDTRATGERESDAQLRQEVDEIVRQAELRIQLGPEPGGTELTPAAEAALHQRIRVAEAMLAATRGNAEDTARGRDLTEAAVTALVNSSAATRLTEGAADRATAPGRFHPHDELQARLAALRAALGHSDSTDGATEAPTDSATTSPVERAAPVAQADAAPGVGELGGESPGKPSAAEAVAGAHAAVLASDPAPRHDSGSATTADPVVEQQDPAQDAGAGR
ncbi:MAG: hypothetical protein ACRDRW_02165 [Pseudonocardiaceae bacterium]